MRRERLVGWSLLAVGLTAAVLAVDLAKGLHGRLRVSVLDVGQGDGILIETVSGRRVLVDGGPDGSVLEQLGRALPLWDRRIDLVVLTHPHADHLASLPAVLSRYDVGGVLLSGPRVRSPVYETFLRLAAGLPVTPSDPATDIDLGDGIVLDVVWPGPEVFGQPFAGDLNDSSVVLRLLDRGTCRMILTGDLEEAGEADLLASGAPLGCEILKVGHHGSRSSTGTGFLLAVSPRVAVISSGRGNTYGHPHAEVLGRLEAAGITIRRTDLEGTVVFEW